MNKRTVIFDSSVWIAYLLEKDKHHSQAVEIIRTYFRQEDIIYVPDIVFYEVISVLVKQKQYILAENFSKLELNITN